MEVTISTGRAGLDRGVVKDIKRLVPRNLIPHNVERQIAMRLHKGCGPLLATGDLVVHRDTDEAAPENICEVVRVSFDEVDLFDPVIGEVLKEVPFWSDLLVFDLMNDRSGAGEREEAAT